MQRKLYLMAKEWRSHSLVHASTSGPHSKRNLILKSGDRRRRNRANEGERGDIGFSLPGKGQGFPREWGGTLLLPVFDP